MGTIIWRNFNTNAWNNFLENIFYLTEKGDILVIFTGSVLPFILFSSHRNDILVILCTYELALIRPEMLIFRLNAKNYGTTQVKLS